MDEEKPRGILKSATEIEAQPKVAPPVTWDEENITLTLHPPGKDYGHMKIDEPKTPYEYNNGSDDEADLGEEPWSPPKQAKLDPEQLESSLNSVDWSSRQLKFEEQAEKMSLEESKANKDFKNKRSAHYNEFLAMKEARAAGLLDDSDDEEDEENGVDQAEKMETEEHPVNLSGGSTSLDVKETKQRRRVSISSEAMPESSKDPGKLSEFEKKRRAHYSGEFKRAASSDK
ncbi:hypothetical protein ACHWQZ_G003944 [Mnemiopsis leidyi]